MKFLFDDIRFQLKEIRSSYDPDNNENYLMDCYKREENLHGTYYPAIDDWSPNFPGNFVLVSMRMLYFHKSQLTPEVWRVSVWGADDIGMDIDVPTREEAHRILKSIPVIIDQRDLFALGFNWF